MNKKQCYKSFEKCGNMFTGKMKKKKLIKMLENIKYNDECFILLYFNSDLDRSSAIYKICTKLYYILFLFPKVYRPRPELVVVHRVKRRTQP